MQEPEKNLETSPYKGVRDFYPEEWFLQKYLFRKMREVAESFGYVEYGASILEPAELYHAKTGEEIISEQTYTFKDRGSREVTLRPEMTPTLARLVAQKRNELPFPLRWYSIPNLFRYERPQKGRLREHFQFNADILGTASQEAEIEIITIAARLMESLGAKPEDFEIRINSRRINKALYHKFLLSREDEQKVSKIIDKRNKISEESFISALEFILGKDTEKFISVLDSNQKLIKQLGEESAPIKELINLIESLDKLGIKNVRFDQNLVRGLDYYTGFIFEIFDTNQQNKRSLFGGGRYDELLKIFGKEPVPAVGFGAGDVTLIEFLKSRNLLPSFESPTDLYICPLEKKFYEKTNELAESLRESGVNVAIDFTDRKIADRIKTATNQIIPFFMCVGENEIESGRYKVKKLSDSKEFDCTENDIISLVKNGN